MRTYRVCVNVNAPSGAEPELVPLRPRHLRAVTSAEIIDPDGGCALRIWFELRGRRGQWHNRHRFDVVNRLRADIALAHTDLRVATLADFPVPNDLGPEAVTVHQAAARGYTQLFAARAARTEPFEPDPTSEFDELGVRMVWPPGIALRRDDGTPELLDISLRNDAVRVPDHIEVLAARAARWCDDDRLVLVLADLLAFDAVEVPLADPGLVQAGRERIERVAEWACRTRDDDRMPDASPGRDCSGCSFIPSCDAVNAQ